MSIDLQNAALATVSYSQLRTEGNRTSYASNDHNDVTKDTLLVTSNPPKRVANSFGNRRSSINLVRTVTIATPDGDVESKDMKFELVCSIPAGTSASDIDEALARIMSLPTGDFDSIAVTGKTQL